MRFSAFECSPCAGGFVIDAHVDEDFDPTASGEELRFEEVFVKASTISARGPGFSSMIDLDTRTARLTTPCYSYPLDMLFRLLLPHLLLRDGLMLHSAFLLSPDGGVVCVGPSGCGKSTLRRLAGEKGICDEFSAVRLLDGRFVAHGLPFWFGSPTSTLLAGIVLPVHGREYRLHRLASAEALRRLARETLWPTCTSNADARAFQTLATLVTAVPVWEFAFRPEEDAVTILLRETRAA